jgi:hypothetical protein
MNPSFKLSVQSSLLVLSVGATPVWALDFVNAQAFQNLDPVIVTDNNTGATAVALKEYNAAGCSRQHLTHQHAGHRLWLRHDDERALRRRFFHTQPIHVVGLGRQRASGQRGGFGLELQLHLVRVL